MCAMTIMQDSMIARRGFGALQGWRTRMCTMTIMQDSMIARRGFGALQGWRTRVCAMNREISPWPYYAS